MIKQIQENILNRNKMDFVTFIEKFGAVIFLILLMMVFGIKNYHFFWWVNIKNILLDFSIYGLMGIGMTYVILIAGIDLSVGSILAFTSMFAAYVMKEGNFTSFVADPNAWGGNAWLLGIFTALLSGAVIGFIQGFLTFKLKLHPFIITLGGMTIWRGATLLLSNGSPVSGFDDKTLWFGQGTILGIPVPIITVTIAFILGYISLHKTKWGRHVYAVGGNSLAARLSGVNVGVIMVSIYTTIGLLSGLAGFLLTARLGSAEAVAGESYELRVIAGVVIGGTSLFGGLGNIKGTLLGSLLIAVLLNGLILLNISSYYQKIAMGLIIIAAVTFDTYAKNRKKS